MQLLNPDACLIGCPNCFPSNPDPPRLPPRRAVRPANSSGDPATGAGCWTSVGRLRAEATGTSFRRSRPPGRPQRSRSPSRPRTPSTRRRSRSRSSTSSGRSLPSRSRTSRRSSTAGAPTFTDGSDGHPLPADTSGTSGRTTRRRPSETLTQDSSCTGAVLQAPVRGREGDVQRLARRPRTTAATRARTVSSPCSGPGRPGSFKVTVTDFVAVVHGGANAYVGGNINVTNQSQVGSSTNISYSYNLCDASAGSCREDLPLRSRSPAAPRPSPLLPRRGPGGSGSRCSTRTAPSRRPSG